MSNYEIPLKSQLRRKQANPTLELQRGYIQGPASEQTRELGHRFPGGRVLASNSRNPGQAGLTSVSRDPRSHPTYRGFSENILSSGSSAVTLLSYLKGRKKNASEAPTCPAGDNH